MQADMHYYGTYCLARAAGFNRNAATELAFAAQMVDDCPELTLAAAKDAGMLIHHATSHHPVSGENLDVADQRRVWVPFHFLPGGQGTSLEEKLVCQMDSPVAQTLLESTMVCADKPWAAAAAGVTAHIYADTFSHHGFSGICSIGNDVEPKSIKLSVHNQNILAYITSKANAFWQKQAALLAQEISHLGHGSVATYPDRPYLRWSFRYQHGKQNATTQQRDNQADFLLACEKLFAFFKAYLAKAADSLKDSHSLTFDDIKSVIRTILAFEGELNQRSQQWIQAAKKGVFTGQSDAIPAYDPDYHFDSPAILHDTRLLHFCAAAAHHKYLILETLLPARGISVLRP